MSICKNGLKIKCKGEKITVMVPNNHPLIKLANVIDWEKCYQIIEEDLKQTSKTKWQIGRKLRVRVHLGVYLLKAITNLSYRKLEAQINENAAYQVFCGCKLIENWRCPDHTRMEKFSARLSPQTQANLANYISQLAVERGFANPNFLDIDSTIQEANIRYPHDLGLISRLVDKSKQIRDALIKSGCELKSSLPNIDAKSIKSQVKEYLFNRKTWTDNEKSAYQLKVLDEAKNYIEPMIEHCKELPSTVHSQLKWNVKQAIEVVSSLGEQCLNQVEIFAKTGTACKDKILSLHQREVSCFKKRGKLALQFGRRFQLGRIAGNFLIVPENEGVQNEDSHSIEIIVEKHKALFGENSLKSCAADSGYYSKSNERYLQSQGVEEIGIQKPGRVKSYAVEMSEDVRKRLYDRRAGIEPLIGHCKLSGQLGRHRERTDKTGLAAAFCSVLGFNMRQMMDKLCNDKQKVTTSST